MHVDDGFVADGDGCRLVSISSDAEQRSCAYDVVATVDAEKLKCCSSLGAFLYFVENEYCASWDEVYGGAKIGRCHHGDSVDIQGICEDVFCPGVLEEVDVDNVVVVFYGEGACCKGFPALPATLENNGLSIGVCLPSNELVYDFSLKHVRPS